MQGPVEEHQEAVLGHPDVQAVAPVAATLCQFPPHPAGRGQHGVRAAAPASAYAQRQAGQQPGAAGPELPVPHVRPRRHGRSGLRCARPGHRHGRALRRETVERADARLRVVRHPLQAFQDLAVQVPDGVPVTRAHVPAQALVRLAEGAAGPGGGLRDTGGPLGAEDVVGVPCFPYGGRQAVQHAGQFVPQTVEGGLRGPQSQRRRQQGVEEHRDGDAHPDLQQVRQDLPRVARPEQEDEHRGDRYVQSVRAEAFVPGGQQGQQQDGGHAQPRRSGEDRGGQGDQGAERAPGRVLEPRRARAEHRRMDHQQRGDDRRAGLWRLPHAAAQLPGQRRRHGGPDGDQPPHRPGPVTDARQPDHRLRGARPAPGRRRILLPHVRPFRPRIAIGRTSRPRRLPKPCPVRCDCRLCGR